MNKLRQSFRRKKDVYVPESSRPHQWQTDEEAVRTGKCSFAVKVTLSTETSVHNLTLHRHTSSCTMSWTDLKRGTLTLRNKDAAYY